MFPLVPSHLHMYVHTTTFSRSTVSLAGPGDPFLLPFSGRKDMGGRVERGRNMRMGLFPYAKVERGGGGGAERGWVQEEKRGRISRWDEQQRQTHTGTYIGRVIVHVLYSILTFSIAVSELRRRVELLQRINHVCAYVVRIFFLLS